jgi:hypothetical protein
MSNDSPSDRLTKEEVYDYLNQNKPLTQIIEEVWEAGFEWGLEYEKD